MNDAKKLLDDALRLPEHERAEMATKLLESLDEPDLADIDDAWAAEIERRCAAVDAGEAVTSDWSEFRRRIERNVFRR